MKIEIINTTKETKDLTIEEIMNALADITIVNNRFYHKQANHTLDISVGAGFVEVEIQRLQWGENDTLWTSKFDYESPLQITTISKVIDIMWKQQLKQIEKENK